MQAIRPRWWLFVLSLVLSVVAVRPCTAGTTDDPVRSALATGRATRVIMQFTSVAERDAAFDRLLERGAAVRVAGTEAGPALVAFGSASLFNSEIPRAARVSLDAGVSVSAVTQPARDRQYPPEQNAPGRSFDAAQTGIAVAIVDSGVQPHADLPPARIRLFKDFVGGSRVPVDGCGHGTHVAGIIAGNGRRSNGFYTGIAPGADIVALRVLGDDCSGNTSDVIDALEWIGRHHETYRIKVVNLSLGHAVLESIFTDPLVQAVERLSRKGVAVVAAAGNRGVDPSTGLPGYGGVDVPCNAPSAICVGSLDTYGSPEFDDDRVSNWSSRGPTRFDLLAKPDLVAPGTGIVSVAAPGSRLFDEFPDRRVPGSSGAYEYFVMSGSSMASPAVAAAAALLLQQNAALTVHALKLSLQFTARLVSTADVFTQGAGALNIAGALMFADAIDPSATRGTSWMRHRLTAANVDANGQAINWGQRIIYGNRFMAPSYAQLHLLRWDDDLVWGYDAIADNIVWGNRRNVWGNEARIAWRRDHRIAWGNVEDSRIAWGTGESDGRGHTADDNLVWGNGVVRQSWAANVVAGFWDETVAWDNVTRQNIDNIVWGNLRGQ